MKNMRKQINAGDFPIQIMKAPEIKKREKRGNYEKNNFLELKKNTISCIECTHQVSI